MTLQEYNDIYKNPVQKSMTITSSGGLTITNTNIVSEKMSLEKSLCSEDNLRYGRCEAACFKITIADIHHNLTDEWLTVEQDINTDENGYLLTENGSYLLTEDGKRILIKEGDIIDCHAVLGRFRVHSDKPTNDRRWRELTCYDAMYEILNADVASWYNSLTFPMTIKNLRDSFFTHLGITQETKTLVNDSFVTMGGFSVIETLSGKTVIEAICELNGCFGQITPSGTFDYVSLCDADTLTLDYYVDGSGYYEDYTTAPITGVNARGTASDVGTFVGTDTNVYVLLGNPLIYGTEGTQALQTALTNLLDHIDNDSFRPFEVSAYGNPMLPLGTKLTVITRDQTIVSYVIRKTMTGIQGLRDRFVAKSEKVQPALVNNMVNDIVRTKGKTHELEISVDGLTSRVTSTETNLQTNYSTTQQTQSLIQTSASSVLSQVSNTYVTQTTYNAEIQNLQDQIDGRIEYFDGNVVPTLNNPPANSWTTTAAKDSHVGDLYRYHYTDQGVEKTDYYRFDKDTSTNPPTYSWVTLGESEADEALRQAELANQKADAAQAQLDALELDVTTNYSTTSQMQSAIAQSAEDIVSTVSEAQSKYDTSGLGYTIDYYGYGTPPSAQYPPASCTGKYYLDNSSGLVYYCDGTSWAGSGSRLNLITEEIRSTVSQQSNEIVLKVDSNGNIVQAALSSDPSQGTAFQVTADNIDFIANNKIGLTSNNLEIDSTYFKVAANGALTCTRGTIGGWDINPFYLGSKYESGSNYYWAYMQGFTGSSLDRYAFALDTYVNGSLTHPFYVTYGGKLYANNAEIAGNITANTGAIGGWVVNAHNIYKEATDSGITYGTTLSSSTASGANGFAISVSRTEGSTTTYPFVVRNNGSMIATNANITGTISSSNLTATGGKIAGFDIDSSGLFMLREAKYSGIANNLYVFAAGASSKTALNSAPFRVSSIGNIITRNIHFTESAGDIGTLSESGLVRIAGSTSSGGRINIFDASGNSVMSLSGGVSSQTTMINLDGLLLTDRLVCTGTKSRTATTEDYGEKLLYCYETPSPMFGDIGEGKIAEDGKCYVWLDSTFSETIKTESYQVFLQKYGQGECYVTERTPRYFVVEGSPNMAFGWELKARQAGFENLRLETHYKEQADTSAKNYGEDAIKHLYEIRNEREVA